MYGIGIVQVRSDSYERIHRASLSLSLSLFFSTTVTFLSSLPPLRNRGELEEPIRTLLAFP